MYCGEKGNSISVTIMLLVVHVISLAPRMKFETLTPRFIKAHSLVNLKSQRYTKCTTHAL